MPDTLLILHVKGTEAETAQFPKHVVRAAISKGEITHSQLIWSTSENTWKPVRELPDLLTGENLILHVKGTEAETAELPKHMVRAAVSEGKLTHSQLIWSTVDNSWKQVREFPDLLPSEHLILHVKGTEAQTTELPKRAIRAAISKGEITHSQLIWSTAENAWKQVRELPDLLPSQKLAPAPSRAAAVPVAKPVDAIIPESPAGPVARAAATAAAPPRVRVAGSSAGIPHVRVAVASASPPRVSVATASASPPRVSVATASASPPRVSVATASASPPRVSVATASANTPTVRAAAPVPARSTGDLTVKEDEGPHPLKWVCIGLGIFILLVLGGNYLLVDHPLVSNLGQTSYSNVRVYAHFGAFMQPNVMVIHIPASPAITPDNLIDFLVALAHSTPQSPITGDLYERVALTSGWTGQYSFSGGSWKELGDMRDEDKAELKEALLVRLADAGGQPLVPEGRDQVWETFVAHFTAKR